LSSDGGGGGGRAPAARAGGGGGGREAAAAEDAPIPDNDDITGTVATRGSPDSMALGAMVETSPVSNISSDGRLGRPGSERGRVSVGTVPNSGL